MIAYLILFHRYPEQFKRLFKAVYHPDNHYLIHVDLKSGPKLLAEIQLFLADYPNAHLLKGQKAQWGGYSLVEAELRGIQALLDIDAKWEFFINLSGQDFPLKSQNYLCNFLRQHPDTEFIKLAKQQETRPETMHRVENFVEELNDDILLEPVQKRDYLAGVTPYIGNQWMILSRKFCEFVSHNPEVQKFKDFYRNTFIADEGFFQTVLMNTSYQPLLVNDDKRAIDWVQMAGEIKLRPRNFIAADASSLIASTHLFARKFDETVDHQIFSLLEAHLASTQPKIKPRPVSHLPFKAIALNAQP